MWLHCIWVSWEVLTILISKKGGSFMQFCSYLGVTSRSDKYCLQVDVPEKMKWLVTLMKRHLSSLLALVNNHSHFHLHQQYLINRNYWQSISYLILWYLEDDKWIYGLHIFTRSLYGWKHYLFIMSGINVCSIWKLLQREVVDLVPLWLPI